MTRSLVIVLLGCAVAAPLAGCGASTKHITRTITRRELDPHLGKGTTSTSTETSTSRSTPTPRSSTTAAPPAESAAERRSPLALLGASARALRAASGYAMSVDLREGDRPLRITLTSSGGRSLDAAIHDGASISQIINLPPRTYLRGNAPFWRSSGGRSATSRQRAALLANRWIQVPTHDRGGVLSALGSLAPTTVARCLTEDNGALSFAGHVDIDGRAAILIRDAGDRPGATPGTLAVAASGPPYPLRYTASGPSRPGGHVDVCNDGKGSRATGTIGFSRFGRIPELQPPGPALSAGPGSQV